MTCSKTLNWHTGSGEDRRGQNVLRILSHGVESDFIYSKSRGDALKSFMQGDNAIRLACDCFCPCYLFQVAEWREPGRAWTLPGLIQLPETLSSGPTFCSWNHSPSELLAVPRRGDFPPLPLVFPKGLTLCEWIWIPLAALPRLCSLSLSCPWMVLGSRLLSFRLLLRVWPVSDRPPGQASDSTNPIFRCLVTCQPGPFCCLFPHPIRLFWIVTSVDQDFLAFGPCKLCLHLFQSLNECSKPHAQQFPQLHWKITARAPHCLCLLTLRGHKAPLMGPEALAHESLTGSKPDFGQLCSQKKNFVRPYRPLN